MMVESNNDERERLLTYFEYGHLPERLQEASSLYSALAHDLDEQMSQADHVSSEHIMALRKLVESKDCAVRAALDVRRNV